MKGIILAGGLGERLRPVTGDRPKPLVEFMTQRVLDGVVKMLIKNGELVFVLLQDFSQFALASDFGNASD